MQKQHRAATRSRKIAPSKLPTITKLPSTDLSPRSVRRQFSRRLSTSRSLIPEPVVTTSKRPHHSHTNSTLVHPHNTAPLEPLLPRTFYSPHGLKLPVSSGTSIPPPPANNLHTAITPSHLSAIMQQFPFADMYSNTHGPHSLSHPLDLHSHNNSTRAAPFTTLNQTDGSDQQRRIKLSIGVSGGVDSLSSTILLSQWAQQHNDIVSRYWALQQTNITRAALHSINGDDLFKILPDHSFDINADLLQHNIQVDISAITVNHGLRDDAYDETFYVKYFCESICRVPCDIVNIHMNSLQSADHSPQSQNRPDTDPGYYALRSTFDPVHSNTLTHQLQPSQKHFTKEHFHYHTNTASLPNSSDIPTQSSSSTNHSMGTSSSVQDSARILRYNSIFNHLIQSGSSAFITGHHLLDQHETIFYRLLRGSGFHGLQGIDAISPVFYYPVANNHGLQHNHQAGAHPPAATDSFQQPTHSPLPAKTINKKQAPLQHGVHQRHHSFIPVLRPFLTFTKQGMVQAFVNNTTSVFEKNTSLDELSTVDDYESNINESNTLSGLAPTTPTTPLPQPTSILNTKPPRERLSISSFHGWLEDPSNQSESYDRIKMRTFLKQHLPITTLRFNPERNAPDQIDSMKDLDLNTRSPKCDAVDPSLGLDDLELLSRQVHGIVTEFMSSHVVFNSSLRQCTMTLPLHDSSLGQSETSSAYGHDLLHLADVPESIIDQAISRCISIISNETTQPRHNLVEDVRAKLLDSLKPSINPSNSDQNSFDIDLRNPSHPHHHHLILPNHHIAPSTATKPSTQQFFGLQDCRIWSELVFEALPASPTPSYSSAHEHHRPTSIHPTMIKIPRDGIIPSKPTHIVIHMNYGYPSPLNQNQYTKKRPSGNLTAKINLEGILASSTHNIVLPSPSLLLISSLDNNTTARETAQPSSNNHDTQHNLSFSTNASFNVHSTTTLRPHSQESMKDQQYAVPMTFSPFKTSRRQVVDEIKRLVDRNYRTRLMEIHESLNCTSDDDAAASFTQTFPFYHSPNPTLNTFHCYRNLPETIQMSAVDFQTDLANNDEFRQTTLLTNFGRHIEAAARKLTSFQPALHLYSIDRSGSTHFETKIVVDYYPVKAYKCLF